MERYMVLANTLSVRGELDLFVTAAAQIKDGEI
jgi:hypothetical protein